MWQPLTQESTKALKQQENTADWVRPPSESIKVSKKLTGKNWTRLVLLENTLFRRQCQCESDVSQTLQSKPIEEIDKPLFGVLRKKECGEYSWSQVHQGGNETAEVSMFVAKSTSV